MASITLKVYSHREKAKTKMILLGNVSISQMNFAYTWSEVLHLYSFESMSLSRSRLLDVNTPLILWVVLVQIPEIKGRSCAGPILRFTFNQKR